MTKILESCQTHKCLDLNDLQGEQWVDVAEFEGIYRVSNMGRVKALSISKKRGRSYQMRGEYMLKQKLATNGYLGVTLQNNSTRKFISVHRLVALHFIPNPENKPTVNHKFGSKNDNRSSGLEWATHKEQINHADSTGLRDINGENHKMSKLNNESVAFIRNSGLSVAKLAEKFDVNQTCIRKVIKCQTWAHL